MIIMLLMMMMMMMTAMNNATTRSKILCIQYHVSQLKIMQ